jgi:hypothetical protein
MVKKLVGLSSQPSGEQFKVLSVVELHEYANKEAKVACCIHEMATRTFIFWFPNLQHHGLCEHLLRQFGLDSHCREWVVWSIIIDDMSGLQAMLVV